MSRIGKKAITLSDQINMTIENNIIIIEGPKGKLSQKISKSINYYLSELTMILKSQKNYMACLEH